MTTATRTTGTEVTDRLNLNVAIAADLRSQVKQAHWNIVGPTFIALHLLFDQQADLMTEHIDLFAERMRALNAVPSGTIRQAAEASTLPDLEARELPVQEAIGALVTRFEMYSASLKDAMDQAGDANDLSTQDIYIEAQREVDKHAWFLRSHLAEGRLR